MDLCINTTVLLIQRSMNRTTKSNSSYSQGRINLYASYAMAWASPDSAPSPLGGTIFLYLNLNKH